MKSKLANALRSLGLSFLIAIITVAAVEGFSSLILFLQGLISYPQLPLAESRHTRYDPRLGWKNIGGIQIEDMYGPGMDLTINSQGIRSRKEFGASVPRGQLRMVCSGDSFTFGVGVGDEHTWPQLLSARDRRWETVNLGLGGYDLGQAYLWYRESSLKLEHDVHILALVPPLLARMQVTELLGYGKPRLNLREGDLIVENTPVPRRAFYVPWMVRNSPVIGKLRSVELFNQLRGKAVSPIESEGPLTPARVREVASAIFEKLREMSRSQKRTLVLVFLPLKETYYLNTPEAWQSWCRSETAKGGYLFIDLVDEFKKLPPAVAEGLFLPPGDYDYRYAAGHYSPAGNKFIADSLYQKLVAIPEIAKRLKALE